MNTEELLKFYTCKSNPDFGQPIILVTSSNTKVGGLVVSEYFIFIKKPHDFYGLQIFSNKFTILDTIVDLQFMLKEAKTSAQGKIDNILYELNEDKNDTQYLLYETNLIEDSFFQFLLLVKSKEFYKEVVSVRNKTKSENLKELIDNILDSDIDDKISMKDIIAE